MTETEDFLVYNKKDSDVLEFYSHWETEGLHSPVFRWVSDDKYDAVYLNLDKPTSPMKYLHLCGETFNKGSDDLVSLSVYDSNSKYIGRTSLRSNYDCQTVPVKKNSFPFKILHDKENVEYASAVDNRRLVYRLMYIGVSNSQHPPNEVYYNEDKDISLNNVDIRLGRNWHHFESFNSETFRWARHNAEIFVRPIKDNTQLNMIVEKGESAGDIGLTISLIDEEKNIIDSCHVVKRTDCLFKLPLTSLTSRWTIISDARNNPVSYDHRLLNYRIFSMELK